MLQGMRNGHAVLSPSSDTSFGIQQMCMQVQTGRSPQQQECISAITLTNQQLMALYLALKLTITWIPLRLQMVCSGTKRVNLKEVFERVHSSALRWVGSVGLCRENSCISQHCSAFCMPDSSQLA